MLHDRGAWRDVVASLAEGLARRDDLARRLGVDVVVQLDEPMVGRVIDGEIAPLTRLDVNRAIPAPRCGRRAGGDRRPRRTANGATAAQRRAGI